MALEIIEEVSGAPTGSFTPHADQKRYATVWAKVEGNDKGGAFLDARTVENGIVSGDGRRKMKCRPYTDEKNKTHDISHAGQKLREYIIDREDVKAMDAYSAGLSNERVASYMQPVNVQSTAQQVGIQKQGAMSEVQIPSTHQF